MSRSMLYGFALTACLIAATFASTCYKPNGTVAAVLPCQPDAEVSICCDENDMCLTNGLCKTSDSANNNRLGRYSCTDPTWQSPTCPTYCFNSTTDPAAASNGIWWVYQCSETTYCCGYNFYSRDASDYSCCIDTLRLFDAGPVQYLAGNSFEVAQFPATYTSSSVPTTSIATISATTTISASTTANVQATPTSGSSSSSQSSALSIGAKVGIAIGAVALASIIIGAFWIWRRQTASVRHTKNAISELPATWQESHEKQTPVEAFAIPPEADSNARAELEGSSGTYKR